MTVLAMASSPNHQLLDLARLKPALAPLHPYLLPSSLGLPTSAIDTADLSRSPSSSPTGHLSPSLPTGHLSPFTPSETSLSLQQLINQQLEQQSPPPSHKNSSVTR